MNWSDIGKAIGGAAPILGGLLGGPAGAAIGSVVSATLGVENTPDSVDSALRNNPEALLRLKELQENSKVELQKLAVQAEQNRLQSDLETYKAEASDRASARLLAAQQQRDFIRPAVTVLMLLGGIGIVLLVFSGYAKDLLTDPTASITVGTLIGLWFGEVKQVLAFWFGATKDSNRTAEAITKFATSPDMVIEKTDKGNNK
ncbi:hypothetical protein KYLE_63 [Pantoea phage Kyle]|uniref:Holin n=1 Tax=Pantoea phage Kyle TaxID=2589665 RepID=A0A514A8S6_9CAUD|nr:hypothetical protein HWC52_gp063 [Pantoea phage Kyle]QDH49672.1 hypothetical protein KYLE_63 [Pantoea phage Kyle]